LTEEFIGSAFDLLSFEEALAILQGELAGREPLNGFGDAASVALE
jgi:hypothetical protein